MRLLFAIGSHAASIELRCEEPEKVQVNMAEWQPRRLTPAQLEERRLAAGRLLRAGRLSQAAIARRFDVSEAAGSRWPQRLRAQGPVGHPLVLRLPHSTPAPSLARVSRAAHTRCTRPTALADDERAAGGVASGATS